MTILAAYKNSATAKAALHTALDIARETGEEVVVVNAGPGGEHRSKSLITEAEQLELQAVLDASGVPATLSALAKSLRTLSNAFSDEGGPAPSCPSCDRVCEVPCEVPCEVLWEVLWEVFWEVFTVYS